VQGELVVGDVLLTLRGSPTYEGGCQPYGVPDEITYTDADGVIIDKQPVPAEIGSDPETCEPIGGRKEHEGPWLNGDRLLIGIAVGRKPNYGLSALRAHLSRKQWPNISGFSPARGGADRDSMAVERCQPEMGQAIGQRRRTVGQPVT
jgi:hypothetical protein